MRLVQSCMSHDKHCTSHFVRHILRMIRYIRCRSPAGENECVTVWLCFSLPASCFAWKNVTFWEVVKGRKSCVTFNNAIASAAWEMYERSKSATRCATFDARRELWGVDRDTLNSAPLQPQCRHGVATAAADAVLVRCFVCDIDNDNDHTQSAMTLLLRRALPHLV